MARRWSQIVANPIRRVKNVVLAGHIRGELLIFPILASLIHVQNGLFEVLCAVHGAGNGLLRAEARQEGLHIVHITFDVSIVFYLVCHKLVNVCSS